METLVYIIAVALAILLGLILYGTIAKNKWGVVTIDRGRSSSSPKQLAKKAPTKRRRRKVKSPTKGPTRFLRSHSRLVDGHAVASSRPGVGGVARYRAPQDARRGAAWRRQFGRTSFDFHIVFRYSTSARRSCGVKRRPITPSFSFSFFPSPLNSCPVL
jgi:hypothetical protein